MRYVRPPAEAAWLLVSNPLSAVWAAPAFMLAGSTGGGLPILATVALAISFGGASIGRYGLDYFARARRSSSAATSARRRSPPEYLTTNGTRPGAYAPGRAASKRHYDSHLSSSTSATLPSVSGISRISTPPQCLQISTAASRESRLAPVGKCTGFELGKDHSFV